MPAHEYWANWGKGFAKHLTVGHASADQQSATTELIGFWLYAPTRIPLRISSTAAIALVISSLVL